MSQIVYLSYVFFKNVMVLLHLWSVDFSVSCSIWTLVMYKYLVCCETWTHSPSVLSVAKADKGTSTSSCHFYWSIHIFSWCTSTVLQLRNAQNSSVTFLLWNISRTWVDPGLQKYLNDCLKTQDSYCVFPLIFYSSSDLQRTLITADQALIYIGCKRKIPFFCVALTMQQSKNYN